MGRQREERAEREDEVEDNTRDGCLSCTKRAEMHLNYAWGLSCQHPAQKAGVKARGVPAAPCRITAMANLGEIYSTPLGPVNLSDLRREFESYLAAMEHNDGAIPADAEVRVASRLKIYDANSHVDLGYAYAHPNINGRPRYAAPHARAGLQSLF